ncbi:MAG: ATP synthase F1 subunit epsilon [Clostridia bacterium]|nr:ATP synthase F1 subunit epsilon [Clostridia bacterium]
MNSFKLEVLASDKPFYEGDCTSLVIPTTQGQYGIQAKHSNVICAIVPGTLKFTVPSGERIIAAVSQGIAKVENNHVLLLVDTAEYPEEIDENIVRRAAEEAEEEILQKRSIQDYYAAQVRMARAINRLRVKREYTNK